MSRLLLAFVLLLAARPLAAQTSDGLPLHIVLGGYMVSAFADLSVTEYYVGKGTVREANPLFRPAVEKGPVTAAIVKGSVHTAVAWWLLRAHAEHPKLAFWSAAALCGAQLAVNARTVRGTR